jgi:hypothetical protein
VHGRHTLALAPNPNAMLGRPTGHCGGACKTGEGLLTDPDHRRERADEMRLTASFTEIGNTRNRGMLRITEGYEKLRRQKAKGALQKIEDTRAARGELSISSTETPLRQHIGDHQSRTVSNGSDNALSSPRANISLQSPLPDHI